MAAHPSHQVMHGILLANLAGTHSDNAPFYRHDVTDTCNPFFGSGLGWLSLWMGFLLQERQKPQK
eukprot:2039367-Amphidinium_carterae.1